MASQSNSALPSVVRSIEGRVERLIEDHQRLTAINRELIQQRDALLLAKRQQQTQIAKLERELAIIELTQTLSGAQLMGNDQREGQGRGVEQDARGREEYAEAGKTGGERGNKRARAYVNRLLREVDACIKLLSSM